MFDGYYVVITAPILGARNLNSLAESLLNLITGISTQTSAVLAAALTPINCLIAAESYKEDCMLVSIYVTAKMASCKVGR
jgi:hypothetical protein